jgi:hypothetical protein
MYVLMWGKNKKSLHHNLEVAEDDRGNMKKCGSGE